jgi:hypothetical protein
MFFPDTLVLVVAPTERQAKTTFAKIARFHTAAGGTVDTKSARKMGLEFENGSQIEALPGNPEGVRGYSADLVILDEGSFMADELYEALRPSLAATNGDLIAISTPNGMSGWFYKAWSGEGGEDWERYRVPSNECPRISSAFLEAERKSMPERIFRREYLCEFLDADDAAFDSATIDSAYTDDFEPFLA